MYWFALFDLLTVLVGPEETKSELKNPKRGIGRKAESCQNKQETAPDSDSRASTDGRLDALIRPA